MPFRSAALNLSLLLSSTLLCFFLLELALRIRQTFQGLPFFLSADDFSDSELGWKGRYFAGNPAKRPKILFLGDSFTDGLGIPQSALYFSVASAAAGAEPFAYGGKGYGTLQEFLALKRFLPKVKPDLIVLQLCVNDFLNNSWELERQSYLQNALLPRPYLQDSEIKILFPRRFPGLRSFVDSHFRLAHLALTRMEIKFHELALQKKIPSIENLIVASKGNTPEFRRAVETTREILGMLMAEAGRVPVVAFEADEIPPYHSAFLELTRTLGIPLFPEIASSIMDAEKQRRVVRLPDNVHWNEEGHRIAGTALAIRLADVLGRLPHSAPGISTSNQP